MAMAAVAIAGVLLLKGFLRRILSMIDLNCRAA